VAKHLDKPIGKYFNGEEANATKEATLENSGFLNGLLMKDAIGIAVNKIEELGIGKRKVNYRMRDAGFSRQRYWGEPFPIIWENGQHRALSAAQLPLTPPPLTVTPRAFSTTMPRPVPRALVVTLKPFKSNVTLDAVMMMPSPLPTLWSENNL